MRVTFNVSPLAMRSPAAGVTSSLSSREMSASFSAAATVGAALLTFLDLPSASTVNVFGLLTTMRVPLRDELPRQFLGHVRVGRRLHVEPVQDVADRVVVDGHLLRLAVDRDGDRLGKRDVDRVAATRRQSPCWQSRRRCSPCPVGPR